MATIADQMQTRRNRVFPTVTPAPTMPNAQAMPAATGGLMPQATTPQQPQMPKAPGYDDSAASNVAKITSSNSPLMQMAAAQGMAGANRRGLINSSMAVGAAQGEVIKAATPLAVADANVNAQKNLQATDSEAQMARLQEQGKIAGQQQQTDISAQMERLQTTNAAEMSRLQSQLANANEQQANDIRAQMERLKVSGDQELSRLQAASGLESDRMRLQSSLDTALQATGAEQQRALVSLQSDLQSKLQTQTDAAAMARLGAQFAQEISVQSNENRSALERIAATGDQNIRQALITADQERQSLAMQLAAGDREKVANSTVQIFAAEAAMRQALLSNTTMPAAERASYEAAISSLGDPVRAFLNQLYGGPAQTAAPRAAPVSVAPTTGPGAYTGGGLLTQGNALRNMRELI